MTNEQEISTITRVLNLLKDKQVIHEFLIREDTVGLQITEEPDFIFLDLGETKE